MLYICYRFGVNNSIVFNQRKSICTSVGRNQYKPVERMIQVRYRKDPHMQNSMRKLKLTLTLTLTLTDTGGILSWPYC